MNAPASRHLIGMSAAAGMLVGLVQPATTQTMMEHSAEARFQLDVRVPEAALLPLLPPGFTLNVAAQGAAKDANLRVVFIDRLTINAPDGKPVGSNRLVYLIAPVKDPTTGGNAQVVIGGLTADPSDAPGPFGVYLHAATHTLERSVKGSGDGPVVESQDWVFAAPSGERLEMHITFERGVGNKGNPSEVRFYSAKNPGFYQISRQEQVLEILRNVTTSPPDRVKSFSFTAGGGSYAKLFDGTERMLSWDNILWINRSISVP